MGTTSNLANFALAPPRCVWPAQALLGEGLCWSPPEQALYWVDIQQPRLLRYTPASGERREWGAAFRRARTWQNAKAP